MVVGQAVNDSPQPVRTGMMASDTMVRSAYLPYWASAVLATLGSWACSCTSASASVLAGSVSGIVAPPLVGRARVPGGGEDVAYERPDLGGLQLASADG